MAITKNALIRYKTIDKCLQNHYRKWTLDDLIQTCSDALYEYEGRNINVSKRTIQLDIQMMRSDKLGYNAPIVVYDKKYYQYEDPNYSITDIPINESDMNVLSETVEMLKQFKDFSLFSELGGIIQRLEDKIHTEKTHQAPAILLDKNENLKGLEHLDVLYQSILKKMVLNITYQSFKAREKSVILFHPFLLREFNNRWFLVGKSSPKKPIVNLALDRIISIDYDLETDYLDESFDGEAYYKNTIGVSVLPEDQVQEVLLYVSGLHAPYVITKPLHASQEVVEQRRDRSIIIRLWVHHNFELERIILGFGDGIRVIAPDRLRRSVRKRLENALDNYYTEISRIGLKEAVRKLNKAGFSILQQVYTKQELNKLKKELTRYFEKHPTERHGKRKLLKDIPQLKPLILNENLRKIIQAVNRNAYLIKATYFDKPSDSNWKVNWHQDKTINLTQKEDLEGFSMWTQKGDVISVVPPLDFMRSCFSIRIHLDQTRESNGALKVLNGTHQKYLNDEEIRVISENANAFISEINAGGVQLLRPLILHASGKNRTQKRRRVIHLEFASQELDANINWLEQDDLSIAQDYITKQNTP